jgi:hypothetical protein
MATTTERIQVPAQSWTKTIGEAEMKKWWLVWEKMKSECWI